MGMLKVEDISTTIQRSLKPLFHDAFMALDFPSTFGQELWQELYNEVELFKASEQCETQRQDFLQGGTSGKDFLMRPSWPKPEGPWAKVAEHSALLQIAREYFGGGDPLLADCDLWHSEPMPEGREATMSQNWHVDLEAGRFAHRIFKAFLYFNDIETGNGPLTVWKAGSSLEKNGPVELCVPKGTMVLVDTGALLHKGGYCVTGPRTVGLWYYTNGSELKVPSLTSGRLAGV